MFKTSISAFAQSGCCSWHGGESYCDYSTNRWVCADGSYSPTCTCGGGSFYQPPPSCPLMSYYDSLSGQCKCYSGYIASGGQCVSTFTYCTNLYGFNAQWDYAYNRCKCGYGYVFNSSSTKCISQDEACQNQYGFSSKYDSLKDACVCQYGYHFEGSQCVIDTAPIIVPIPNYQPNIPVQIPQPSVSEPTPIPSPTIIPSPSPTPTEKPIECPQLSANFQFSPNKTSHSYDVHSSWNQVNGDGFSVSLNQNKYSDPGPLVDTKGQSYVFGNVPSGTNYFHLKVMESNQWCKPSFWVVEVPKWQESTPSHKATSSTVNSNQQKNGFGSNIITAFLKFIRSIKIFH